MIVGDDFQKLQRQVEQIREAKAKADGAVGEILKRLKKEFGCKSLAEAQRKLKELEQEERDQFVAYREARDEFDKKWKDKLGDLQ